MARLCTVNCHKANWVKTNSTAFPSCCKYTMHMRYGTRGEKASRFNLKIVSWVWLVSWSSLKLASVTSSYAHILYPLFKESKSSIKAFQDRNKLDCISGSSTTFMESELLWNGAPFSFLKEIRKWCNILLKLQKHLMFFKWTAPFHGIHIVASKISFNTLQNKKTQNQSYILKGYFYNGISHSPKI